MRNAYLHQSTHCTFTIHNRRFARANTFFLRLQIGNEQMNFNKTKKKNPTLQRLSNWISLNFTLLSHRDFDFFLARPLENKMKWMLSKSIKNVLFYYYLRKRDSGSEPQLPFSYIRRFNDGIIDRFISAIGDENGRENCVEIQSCAFSWILSSCDECSFNSFFGQRQ